MPDLTVRKIHPVIQGSLLLALTLLAYAPIYGGGFVWDDDAHLLNNVVLQEHGLYRAWLAPDHGVYYPMASLSYWIDHRLWGLSPKGFHATNVLIHALSSLLIWRILLRLRIPGAWLAALLFALHPVNVESAAWITQRKNTLCLFFYATSILLYLRDREGDGPTTLTRGAAITSFLLSMLSKGAGAALPAVLLLLGWFRRGRIEHKDFINSLPFFAVAAVMSGLEISFQYGDAIAAGTPRPEGFFSRLAGAGWVAGFYLFKALLPVQLSFVYPRWDINPSDLVTWLPNVGFALALIIAWRVRHRIGRGLLTALLYFLLGLAPVIGFFEFYYMTYSLVGDHYQYIALPGIMALVTGGGAYLLGRARSYGLSTSLGQRIAIATGTLIAALFFTGTLQRSAVFADSEILWIDAIAKNPSGYLPRYNLGLELQQRGEYARAAGHYQALLETYPDSAEVHNNLGSVLLRMRRADQARRHFERVLEFEPNHTEALNNLGNALEQLARLDDAVDAYGLAVQTAPGLIAPRLNLARALKKLGREEEARRERETIRRLRAQSSTD
ncbi:MAG: tetratricopeptide repeat protein [Myxococcota bacterium]|nr:tetratricopeptide repeat protein [Myxococcota bacterium]